MLSYAGLDVDFEDRTLIHLQVVIVNRFRRGQSVLLSWRDAQSTGEGRTSPWLSHTQPVLFHFLGSRSPAIDREWLHALQAAADSGAGLIVIDTAGLPVTAAARRAGSSDLHR